MAPFAICYLKSSRPIELSVVVTRLITNSKIPLGFARRIRDIRSLNRDEIFKRALLLATGFGTNYVVGAFRRRRPREPIANRRRLRGRRHDGNPIGRIRLVRFVAPRGDGLVTPCDPRVPGVISPWRLHLPVLVLLGPLGHRSQETQVRSSPRT